MLEWAVWQVRMPITSDLASPRNFVFKIANYEKVVDVPNSMTVLDEMLPYSIEMAKRQLTGLFGVTVDDWNFLADCHIQHSASFFV